MSGSPRATVESPAERRLRRAAWPVRSYRLGEEPPEGLQAEGVQGSAWDAMWRLAVDSYSWGGRLTERTPRDTWPVRIRRLGEPVVD